MWFLLGAMSAILFVALGLWLALDLGLIGVVLWLLAFAGVYLGYHALQRRLGAHDHPSWS